jgi:hypothetical protein
MPDNTRRRPPLGPASRPYHPCISRNQPAPLSDHRPLPRGGVRLKYLRQTPSLGHRRGLARAREAPRSSHLFAPRPLRTWVSRPTARQVVNSNCRRAVTPACCEMFDGKASLLCTDCTNSGFSFNFTNGPRRPANEVRRGDRCKDKFNQKICAISELKRLIHAQN